MQALVGYGYARSQAKRLDDRAAQIELEAVAPNPGDRPLTRVPTERWRAPAAPR
jgi:hypothetical protein